MKKLVLLLVPVFLVISACQERECVDLNKEKEDIELVLEKYVIANEDQKIELAEEIIEPERHGPELEGENHAMPSELVDNRLVKTAHPD